MRVLSAIAAAKTRPTRHTDSCHGVVWLGAAREHTAVHEVTEPGHEVLRAPRVPSEPMPAVPADLHRWVQVSERNLTEPVLVDHGPDNGVIVELDDVPQKRDRFGRWRREWETWATAERIRRARAAVHDELFRLHRVAEDRPESVEIVLGGGLLHLPDPATGGIHIHVVNQPVDLVREAATGDMVVSLTEAPARLEDDEILAGEDWFDGSGGPTLRERLDEDVASAIDPAVAGFVKEWRSRALRLHSEADDGWAEPTGRVATVTRAPAIVARPRSGYALRNYYDTIIRALEDDHTPIPLGLAQLVAPLESDVRLGWLERTGKTSGVDLAADPLFPLPANPAQRQIIDRMGFDSGVVVEGPPGTGKTHTIANLVSSLLAQGQRVLVTSEKAQALKVLRDKLPQQMQDLCISMTDASSRGDSDLARSVTRISTAKTSFDAARAERRITDLGSRRTTIRDDRSRLLNEIQALRDAETEIHPEIAPGFAGTTAAIARTLVASTEDAWVRDAVPEAVPLSSSELTELLALLRSETDSRRSRRRQVLPARSDLPPAGRLAQLAESLLRGDQAVSGDEGALVADIENLPDDELTRLDPAARRVGNALAELEHGPGDRRWGIAMAQEQLRGGRRHAWQSAVAQLALIPQAREGDRAAQNADVTVDLATVPVPDAASLDAYALDQEQHGSSFWPWTKSAEQKKIESYGERLLVNGAKVNSAGAARVAAGHLRVIEAAIHLHRVFEPLGAGIHPSAYRADLIDQMSDIAEVCRAVAAVVECQQEIARLLSPLPAARRPRIDSLAGLHRVAGVALQVTDARQARVARHEIATVASTFDVDAGGERSPEHVELLVAWRAADTDRYRRAVEGLDVAASEQRDQRRCDDLMSRLRADAPQLADELWDEPGAPHWDGRFARLPQVWARARATAWMERHQTPGREQTLEQELATATWELGQVTADLAAQRAWKACLEGMSAQEMQALQMYRERANQVGKGTGKYAERFRQAARAAMAEAQHAVPAWIMPIQQVLASVAPEKDIFDVVIVDEASQAELTSAFLLWLAPRMIVVGDDKQCTPAEVTMGALAPIFDRLDNELPDLPAHRRLQFTSKSSVFSLLRSCFPQVIRLQEHFRCMPEIIEWSSGEFYSDAPLVPLRQFGADRLPPLRATHVPDAVQTGGREKIANRREAEVIADLVEQCVADPAYDGLTFGVVVLQGHAQVTLIENVLRGRIGDDEWTKRKLRVGTPPDFQGDERHVIWLSMVLAPDYRSIALSNEMYRQRFNVAASRAQDQLWIVHSMSVEQLGGKDLRRSLLEYMTSADDEALAVMPSGVRRDDRVPGFDSLLEQNVFCDLTEAAHHVTPQLEINGRRLDLVVTGPGGRVAVECDADTYRASDEERRAELDREQELKRAGWRFFRVRESSYVLNRSEVQRRLTEDLSAAGITPLLLDGAELTPVRVIDRAPGSDPDRAISDESDSLLDVGPSSAIAEVAELIAPSRTSPVAPPAAEPGPRQPEFVTEALVEPQSPTRPVDDLLPAPSDHKQLVPEPVVVDEPEVSIDGMRTDEVRGVVVDLVARYGQLTAPALADLIGVPKMEARGLLSDLSVAGRLTKTGTKDPIFTTSRPRHTQLAGGPADSRFSKTPSPRQRVAPPSGFIASTASRRAQVRRLTEEMLNLGAVEPAVDQEVLDPEGGALLCIAELFWADGIHPTGGKPVILELDPEEADIPRLTALGCRVFTSSADLRTTMRSELGRHR